MKERILVYVNDEPVEVYRGMEVRHALIAACGALYDACLTGLVVVRDENGFVVGLEGAPSEGVRLYTAPQEK